MTHTIYLPFVYGMPPEQWQFVGRLERVYGDTLDLSSLPSNEGADVDLHFVASAVVRLNDGLSLAVAIIEDK